MRFVVELNECLDKYKPLKYLFYLLLTISNQPVTLAKQLFKELSFQKRLTIKRPAISQHISFWLIATT